MPEKLCLNCHEKPVAGGLSWTEFCGDDCAREFEAEYWKENHQFTVEQDLVYADELAEMVKKALSEGWTIIAITPHRIVMGVVTNKIAAVSDYILIRSR